jgi:putative sigma-54 modulation protein
MQIHLSPRHVRLTAAIHGHVAEKIEHLEAHTPEIFAAHIVLVHDETAKPADAYSVKVHLAVPGPDIHAEASAQDIYGALDVVIGKLTHLLSKRKTRRKDRLRSKAQKAVRRRKTGA